MTIQQTYRGSCLCGSVRFELDGPFLNFLHCYCNRCRKATGSARATAIVTRPENLRWVAGEPHIHRFDLPEAKSFAVATCERCHAPVPRLSGDQQYAVVPAGSIDDPLPEPPEGHEFWESRANWVRDDESHLPHFPEDADIGG